MLIIDLEMILTDILKSLLNFLYGKLQFPNFLNGKTVTMDDGISFKIFRFMKLKKDESQKEKSVYIVRFKFSRYSHKKNIKLSRIPMFMIAGFQGFRKKVWMINYENNFWQGAYEWENVDAINNYRKSTVLGIMNKRAISDSISEIIIQNKSLDEYLKERISE